MGSNPASPTADQDRFSDPDFFIFRDLFSEVLRPIDGYSYYSHLK